MHSFFHTCVGWPRPVAEEGGLSDMVNDCIDITRRTFLQHVDRDQLQELEEQCGYAKHYKQGLTMASDWHVSYHRSKLYGYVVYYFCQSAIEYVFVPQGVLPCEEVLCPIEL